MTEIILTITITLPIPEPPTPARAKKPKLVLAREQPPMCRRHVRYETKAA